MSKLDSYLDKDYGWAFLNPHRDTTEAKIASLIVLIIVALLIEPWLVFWLAYCAGWFAKILIGKYIVAGFGLLGISIPIDKIPLLAGVLGWVGSFFKSFQSSKNK